MLGKYLLVCGPTFEGESFHRQGCHLRLASSDPTQTYFQKLLFNIESQGVRYSLRLLLNPPHIKTTPSNLEQATVLTGS